MTQFPRGCFITGTDTGVGKTVVTAALAHWLVTRGHDVGVMKPVETGWPTAHPERADAHRLMTASRVNEPLADICLYRFAAPLSPYDAAKAQRVSISLPTLSRSFRALRAQHETMLVEGAGGTLVPLTRSKMMVDLMAALGLPVVVVGRAGLGGINQALLTLECLRARRIRVLAIVLNRTQPNRTALAVRQESSTYEALRSLSGVPVLGPLPHHPQLDCAWDDGIDRMTTHPAIAELGRLILTSNGRTTRRLAPRRERRSRRK